MNSPLESLEAFFAPATVAVIGASDRRESVGRTLFLNLLDKADSRKIFAVNPNHPLVNGRPAYKSIAAIPEKIDLAVIATPAHTVPHTVGECIDAGVKACVVISAGFKEMGPAGAALEREIQNQLRRGSMRLVGPNCLGVMNPILGLNATFSQDIARPGNVAFISQSGALCTAILDWSFREQVGFSGFVSTGSMLDVGWGDLIDHYGDDENTKSILIYMESIGDARSFLSAAREVAFSKPILVIKAGRSEAGSHAAASHTGALTGSDEVFEAAMRRCGVLRVNSLSDLFYMAEVLGKQPRPRGPKLTIVSNAGGPAVLATDALITSGGELTKLSPATMEALDKILPAHWSHGNPVDILGDADPERYERAVEIAASDPGSDGLLIILAPQGMTDPAGVAERMKRFARGTGKPVLASWMGARTVAPGEAVLNSSGIPTFAYPDTAARIFYYMWRYSYNLRGLYETPALAEEITDNSKSRRRAAETLEGIRARGRTLLTEAESKEILSLYGIPTVETRVARTEAEAVAAAEQIGFPVVLKLHSETITHKTDVGGVKLNLADAAAVGEAFRAIQKSVAQKAGPQDFLGVTVQPMVRLDGYELILGSSLDVQFGPVLLFGSGGQLVEVYKDRALALPPLNTTLAERLIEQTRIFSALQGVRGRAPANMPALEKILVQFSRLVVEQRWIKEIDINPLLASSERLLALDARIVLHEPNVKRDQLPRLAVRPYPSQYIASWTMKDGTGVTIRPVRPEDETAMAKFHELLSERSVYFRYFSMASLTFRVSHERLIRNCFIDYDREMALVAEQKNQGEMGRKIIGVARLRRLHGKSEAEVAVIVGDAYQHHGLGTELLRRLIEVAKAERLNRLEAHVLAGNSDMQALGKHFGFHPVETGEPDHLLYVLDL